MGIYTYCFVSGCPTSTKENPQEKFFYLPLNTDLLRKWVTNMGREDVLQKSSSYQRHRRICSVHFTRDCFQTAEKKKLNRGAVPTILAENAIPSMEIIPKLDEVLPGPFKNVRNPLVVVDVAAVQTQTLCTPSTSTELTPSIVNVPNILNRIGEKVDNLTPKKRKIYNELVKVTRLIYDIRRRGGSCIRNFFNSLNGDAFNKYVIFFKKIDKMPAVVQFFVKSQVRLFSIKPKSRRYTIEEKSFYTALFKHSQRGYHFLARFFPMPSSRSINRYLFNINFNPGNLLAKKEVTI